MLELLEVLIGFSIPFAVVYYFFFGGKEKLNRYLFRKMSLGGKMETITKKDLSPEYARATFYFNNIYHRKFSQIEWQEYCREILDPSLDKNSQEYAEAVAPIANAIVVDAEGFYLRRGMEDMSRTLVRFMPGVNDRISLNYFVEPYEYFENKELAAKSMAEEALRKKKFEEQYERERPMREAREAERKAERQRQAQEASDRWNERAARMDQQRQEKQAAHAARARCSQCVNSAKCSIQVKSNPGTCGGYMPRQ